MPLKVRKLINDAENKRLQTIKSDETIRESSIPNLNFLDDIKSPRLKIARD